MLADLISDYRFAGIGSVLMGHALPGRPGFNTAVFARVFPMKCLCVVGGLVFLQTYIFHLFLFLYLVLYIYVFAAST